jgi:hypothetical protein
VIGLLAGLVWVGDATRWPAAETLPQQGEATDAQAADMLVHSSAALARLIREPQNTWSNIAFVFGGAFLLASARQRVTRGVAVTLIVVGVGSFFYHASASRVLRHGDVAAMYWLFMMSVPLCVSALVQRWRARIDHLTVALVIFTGMLAVLVTASRNTPLMGFKPLSLHLATALTAAMVILSIAAVAHRRSTLAAALQLLGIVTLFGIAAACQTNDRPGRRLYRPDLPLQAHAVWHVLAAVTFVWAARFLDGAGVWTAENESPKEPGPSPTSGPKALL